MTKLTKFAIVELNSQTDILANLQSIELGIKIASERGTRMMILPEILANRVLPVNILTP